MPNSHKNRDLRGKLLKRSKVWENERRNQLTCGGKWVLQWEQPRVGGALKKGCGGKKGDKTSVVGKKQKQFWKGKDHKPDLRAQKEILRLESGWS